MSLFSLFTAEVNCVDLITLRNISGPISMVCLLSALRYVFDSIDEANE